MDHDHRTRDTSTGPAVPSDDATRRRVPTGRSASVHLVWALALVIALVTPLFYLKSLRQENRADVGAVAAGIQKAFFTQDVTQHFFSSVSEVGEGKLLELAQLRTQETLTETLSRSWLGLDMHSTVRLDAPVIYRYGVRWDTGWEVTLTAAADSVGRICLVDAPALEPFDPPTIDTSGFRVATEERLLSPDTRESRDRLLRKFTPYAARLARTPEYQSIVRELARRTLTEYVEQWLVNARLVEEGRPVTVYARFADDAPDSLQSGPLEYRTIRFR